MVKIANKDAQWQTIDVATLPDEVQMMHRIYKDAYATMKATREQFEKAMSNAIAPPAGKRVIFGYNFGKLSVAIVDGLAEKRTTVGTQSLADWIAAQRNANRSV